MGDFYKFSSLLIKLRLVRVFFSNEMGGYWSSFLDFILDDSIGVNIKIKKIKIKVETGYTALTLSASQPLTESKVITLQILVLKDQHN